MFCLLRALRHQRAIVQFSRKRCCLGHLSLYWPYTFTSQISSFSQFKMCLVASNAEVVRGLPKNPEYQGLTQTHRERGNSGTRGKSWKSLGSIKVKAVSHSCFPRATQDALCEFPEWSLLFHFPRCQDMEETWEPGAQPPHLQFWCLFLWGVEAEGMGFAGVSSSLPVWIEYRLV